MSPKIKFTINSICSLITYYFWTKFHYYLEVYESKNQIHNKFNWLYKSYQSCLLTNYIIHLPSALVKTPSKWNSITSHRRIEQTINEKKKVCSIKFSFIFEDPGLMTHFRSQMRCRWGNSKLLYYIAQQVFDFVKSQCLHVITDIISQIRNSPTP